MAKKIGIRLYLDGAPKFNSDIRNCNASLKQFQSELKRNSEEFKSSENSLEALSRKSETLSKAYETASQKVETYAKRLEALNKARDEEEKRLESYRSALDDEKRKLSEVETASGKNSEAYQKQAQTVSDLETKIRMSEEALQRFDTEEIRLNTSLNNATAEQLKYGAELERTNGYLAEAEKSTDGCAQSLDKYGREVDEAAEHTRKMSDTLEGIAKNEALEKISEEAKKLLENLMECAKTAEEFEYSIAKVQSIAQVSGNEMKNMSSEIRRVATEMGYGANEIAEATYQAISASVDAADAVGFVEDTTKLARAGFTEVTTAVDVLTTAINAYGQEANTTAHIADNLITTQNLGKTTVDELAQSMGTIIPTASAYGVSLDQLSSAYVILTKQGINTANATTYLRGMLNELGDAGSDVSDILRDHTGHSFGELMNQGYSLGDVLEILGDEVDGNTEAFANLFGNIRAGQGALAIFNQGAKTFNDTLKVMENNAGATDKAFGIMADTAVMVNQRFESSVENLKIAVGESLSPTIAKLKEIGIDVLDKITEIVEANPQLVAALAGGATAVTALAVAATGAATAIALLRLAFGDVSAVAVLAVTGVVAASGAIAGLALSASNATDETEELIQALHESAETGHEVSSSANETIESQKRQAEYVGTLIDKIKTLNSQEDLSKAQKYELKTAVNDLNATLGESVVELDAQTGKLSENSDEWIKNAEAQQKAAETAALQEKLTEVLKEKADIDYQIWETEQELEDVEGRREQIEAEVIEIQKLGIAASQDQLDKLRELYDESDALNEKEQGLKESQEELTTSSEELAGSINNLEEYLGETANTEDEAAEAAIEYADALGVVHESADAVAEANDAIEKAIEGATNAISDQIGIFDEWRTKSELTFSEMQNRWKEQNDGLDQYKDDLSYVKGVIDSDTNPAIKDLAANMVSMGADGAAELHEFVEGLKGIDGNDEALNELAETWQKHNDSVKEAEDIYASITLQEQGYVDDSTALFSQYYADSEDAQREYNSAMEQAAGQGVSDQANAIKAAAPEVESATKSMTDAAVDAAYNSLGIQRGGGTSTVFYDMGKTIDQSLAKGIEDNGGQVATAMQRTLQNAVDRIDVSGVAEKINRKLGEALQG